METWVNSLQRGTWIWLVKEEQHACVSHPIVWQDGHQAGRIGLYRYADVANAWTYTRQEFWYVRADGAGFDYKRLMLPCVQTSGSMPAPPPVIPRPSPWFDPSRWGATEYRRGQVRCPDCGCQIIYDIEGTSAPSNHRRETPHSNVDPGYINLQLQRTQQLILAIMRATGIDVPLSILDDPVARNREEYLTPEQIMRTLNNAGLTREAMERVRSDAQTAVRQLRGIHIREPAIDTRAGYAERAEASD
jgi:hypothetical protein